MPALIFYKGHMWNDHMTRTGTQIDEERGSSSDSEADTYLKRTDGKSSH